MIIDAALSDLCEIPTRFIGRDIFDMKMARIWQRMFVILFRLQLLETMGNEVAKIIIQPDPGRANLP